MTYVDGFVVPVPKSKIAAYRKMAQWGKKVYMKHGAVAFYECMGDDLKSMPGSLTFPKLLKLKQTETVFYSFVMFKSKAHRTTVNKRVMKEFSSMPMPKDMPFDPKRMAYGGFKAVVAARA